MSQRVWYIHFCGSRKIQCNQVSSNLIHFDPFIMLNVTSFFYSYATLQPLQTRNLSQREAYEQQRMQSMQKAEHDRRKFYQDENNEGYPPQSGHHLQQPQAYHHSPYHQHPLRNNNQVHINSIKVCPEKK